MMRKTPSSAFPHTFKLSEASQMAEYSPAADRRCATLHKRSSAYIEYEELSEISQDAPLAENLENGYPVVHLGERFCRMPGKDGRRICGVRPMCTGGLEAVADSSLLIHSTELSPQPCSCISILPMCMGSTRICDHPQRWAIRRKRLSTLKSVSCTPPPSLEAIPIKRFVLHKNRG